VWQENGARGCWAISTAATNIWTKKHQFLVAFALPFFQQLPSFAPFPACELTPVVDLGENLLQGGCWRPGGLWRPIQARIWERICCRAVAGGLEGFGGRFRPKSRESAKVLQGSKWSRRESSLQSRRNTVLVLSQQHDHGAPRIHDPSAIANGGGGIKPTKHSVSYLKHPDIQCATASCRFPGTYSERRSWHDPLHVKSIAITKAPCVLLTPWTRRTLP